MTLDEINKSVSVNRRQRQGLSPGTPQLEEAWRRGGTSKEEERAIRSMEGIHKRVWSPGKQVRKAYQDGVIYSVKCW